MKNLVLFRNLNNLKTDECFLNDILAISTNIPPNLSIYERPPKKTQEHTSEDESKKSSIFDLCLENTLPYLEIILESPHHSLTSLDLDSKEILLTNCCLSALQTFRYLQQKDSYTDLKESLNTFSENNMDWDSNGISLYKRLTKKASENSYLNQFMLYQTNNEVPMISVYCKNLTLELFFNNQRYLSSKTIEKNRENTLLNRHYVFNLTESLSQLTKYSRPSQKGTDYNKLKDTINKFLCGLIHVEKYWNPFNKDNNSNLNEDEWIYYHNRELIFHSRAILSFLFDPSICIKESNFDSVHKRWNDYFLTFAAIPLTYNLSILIKNNPSILYHEYVTINAAFTILLKTFTIYLFNSCEKDLDKCCEKLTQELYFAEKNTEQGKLYSELFFMKGKYIVNLENMEKDIGPTLLILKEMDCLDLRKFGDNLTTLYHIIPKLYFDLTDNFSMIYNMPYSPNNTNKPNKSIFEKKTQEAKETTDKNLLKSLQKSIGYDYYSLLNSFVR